jgi:uncharacterized membrane protein HdeD (DUF308 family)
MLRGRRTGTLTAGITLVVFGLLFIGRMIFPVLDFTLIMSLWPLVLILIGIEVIVSYAVNRDEKMRYDGGAIALVFIMAIFAMVMGCMEFIIEHINELRL